jgi:hypothetical protein
MLFSAELNVPVKAYSQWGVHLLLVEERGEGGAPLSGDGAPGDRDALPVQLEPERPDAPDRAASGEGAAW